MEETQELIEQTPVQAETFEQKQARELREDYLKRALASHAEREAIFRDNGLLKEGESLPMNTAAIDAQCC